MTKKERIRVQPWWFKEIMFNMFTEVPPYLGDYLAFMIEVLWQGDEARYRESV